MAKSERFNKFIDFILKAETVFKKGHYGDYAFAIMECVKGDSGGITKFGIDASSHPNIDVKNLTLEGAKDIYFSEWANEGIEDLPAPFGECFYDAAVNCGLKRAKRFQTISGNNPFMFNKERRAFYERLGQRESLKKFKQGWLNRVGELEHYLGM